MDERQRSDLPEIKNNENCLGNAYRKTATDIWTSRCL